jgi:hypothetical protein
MNSVAKYEKRDDSFTFGRFGQEKMSFFYLSPLAMRTEHQGQFWVETYFKKEILS